MKPVEAEAAKSDQTGARQYQILCFFALGVVFVADVQQGNALLSMLLILVGVWAVLSRLRLGPVFFLVTLGALQLMKNFAWARFGPLPLPTRRVDFPINDVVLSMAVLAFVLAQYRLQSLVHSVLPPDPRRRTGRRRWLILRPRLVLERRPDASVSPHEIGWLLLGLPVWAVLAQGVWSATHRIDPVVGVPIWLSRIIVLSWAIGLAIFIVAALLNLWRRHRSGPQIAALYLQDVLWKETRGEQRRLNRWLAWWRNKNPHGPAS